MINVPGPVLVNVVEAPLMVPLKVSISLAREPTVIVFAPVSVTLPEIVLSLLKMPLFVLSKVALPVRKILFVKLMPVPCNCNVSPELIVTLPVPSAVLTVAMILPLPVLMVVPPE